MKTPFFQKNYILSFINDFCGDGVFPSRIRIFNLFYDTTRSINGNIFPE